MRNGCSDEGKSARSLTLATFGVEKVPERRNMGCLTGAFLRARKDDFQPTKHRTKPSAPKGKQRNKLKCFRWRSISKGFVPKILTTQWAISMYTMDCVACKITVVWY